MTEENGSASMPRFGSARFEAGDPLCDHIYRSPNPLAGELLWLECIHCEGSIQIMFRDADRLPGGAC